MGTGYVVMKSFADHLASFLQPLSSTALSLFGMFKLDLSLLEGKEALQNQGVLFSWTPFINKISEVENLRLRYTGVDHCSSFKRLLMNHLVIDIGSLI